MWRCDPAEGVQSSAVAPEFTDVPRTRQTTPVLDAEETTGDAA